MATSTPSTFLEDVAAKYHLALAVNSVRLDIANDWNFAMNKADAKFVTIAHQDDTYDTEYLSVLTDLAQKHPDMVIGFCDYLEHTSAGTRPENINRKIKRWLCAQEFGSRESIHLPEAKRRLLRLGNPICCPSVIINRNHARDFEFSGSWKTNLDWDGWLRLAEVPGRFVYTRRQLVSKRVHNGSETTVTLANHIRQTEDRRMFERFWPGPVAAAIAAVYSLGYLANRVR